MFLYTHNTITIPKKINRNLISNNSPVVPQLSHEYLLISFFKILVATLQTCFPMDSSCNTTLGMQRCVNHDSSPRADNGIVWTGMRLTTKGLETGQTAEYSEPEYFTGRGGGGSRQRRPRGGEAGRDLGGI